MNQKGKEKLKLKYIGDDFWSHPVYKDQHNHLWKDISCGDSEIPSLYSVVNNDFDGEPEYPIAQEFIIIRDKVKVYKSFNYMMLDRLRSDCDYYLGYGNRSQAGLSGHDEREHIEAMKKIWLEFAEDEKPQWLSWEQILDYERKMCESK